MDGVAQPSSTTSTTAKYGFTYYNRSNRPDDYPCGGYETVVGDGANGEKLIAAARGQNAIAHHVAYTDETWDDILESNILGMHNALEAARKQEVELFVFGSTNHVMGFYKEEFAPELYSLDSNLVLSHTDPVRPDSQYGVSKSFGEDSRYYVENHEYPKQFYALGICTVLMPKYDHLYGSAERGIENGKLKRGSEEYEREVARMKAM